VLLLICKRGLRLSITHKFGSHDETQFNVCEPGQASPDDAIPGRSIGCTGQIAAQSGEFGRVAHPFASFLVMGTHRRVAGPFATNLPSGNRYFILLLQYVLFALSVWHLRVPDTPCFWKGRGFDISSAY
jgi:hypothetical protein